MGGNGAVGNNMFHFWMVKGRVGSTVNSKCLVFLGLLIRQNPEMNSAFQNNEEEKVEEGLS